MTDATRPDEAADVLRDALAYALMLAKVVSPIHEHLGDLLRHVVPDTLTALPDGWTLRRSEPLTVEAGLREALSGLVDGMDHGDDCDAYWDDDGKTLDEPDDGRCSCGLSKAIAALATPSAPATAVVDEAMARLLAYDLHCESFTLNHQRKAGYDLCIKYGRKVDAEYGDEQACWPCMVRAAILAAPGEAGR